MMDKYIGCEALLNALKEERKNGNFVFTSKWIKEIIDNLPSADVVPKSEVEKWKEINERLHKEMSEQMIEERKIERKYVAREIFAEIEEVFCQHTEGGYYLNGAWFPERFDLYTGDAIAELKKKYTEEK